MVIYKWLNVQNIFSHCSKYFVCRDHYIIFYISLHIFLWNTSGETVFVWIVYFTKIIHQFFQFSLILIFVWKSKKKQMHPVTAGPCNYKLFKSTHTHHLYNCHNKSFGFYKHQHHHSVYASYKVEKEEDWVGVDASVISPTTYVWLETTFVFILCASSSVVVNFTTNRLFLHVG